MASGQALHPRYRDLALTYRHASLGVEHWIPMHRCVRWQFRSRTFLRTFHGRFPHCRKPCWRLSGTQSTRTHLRSRPCNCSSKVITSKRRHCLSPPLYRICQLSSDRHASLRKAGPPHRSSGTLKGIWPTERNELIVHTKSSILGWLARAARVPDRLPHASCTTGYICSATDRSLQRLP